MRCIEHGGVLDPFTLLTFQICDKVFVAGLEELIKNKGVHPLHIIGRAVLADSVDLIFFLLHCSQVRTGLVMACFDSNIL